MQNANGWQPLQVLALLVLGAAVLGVVGLLLIHRSLRKLRVPDDASFATTLRIVPLSLVVVLDLLDLGLDIFAAPIVWLVLSRYKLQALRNVAALEALVPFTQVLPTLTVAWFVVRLLGLGERPRVGTIIDADEVSPGQYAPRVGRR